jgi:hypothetical protein
LAKKNLVEKKWGRKKFGPKKFGLKKNWAEKRIGQKYWPPHPQGHATIHAGVFEKIKYNIQKYNINVDQTSIFHQG